MIKLSSSSFGCLAARPPLHGKAQRIGLLGGTFNPPHEGHLLIAQIALRRLQLDALWWLVTPGNPLKDHNELPPLQVRMHQCRELANDARMTITGFEKNLTNSYTASTLAHLRLKAPSARLVWIMGADNLASIDQWQSWQTIFKTIPIAVVDRPGWHLQALSSKAAKTYEPWRLPEHKAACLPFQSAPAWSFLTGPLSAQSSTIIRSTPHKGD